MGENEVKREIVEYAKGLGHKVYRMNAGSPKKVNFRGAPPGTPDLLIVIPGGRCLWVEVKDIGKKASYEQLEHHKELKHRGHTVIVACAVITVALALERMG